MIAVDTHKAYLTSMVKRSVTYYHLVCADYDEVNKHHFLHFQCQHGHGTCTDKPSHLLQRPQALLLISRLESTRVTMAISLLIGHSRLTSSKELSTVNSTVSSTRLVLMASRFVDTEPKHSRRAIAVHIPHRVSRVVNCRSERETPPELGPCWSTSSE